MARWSVYLECNGSPLYAEVELEDWDEDDPKSEDEAWQEILDNYIMPTFEVTREDD